MRILALLCAFASTTALAGETTCSVMLTDTGDQKINVIKIVREYTSLGLKEAKDLVEAPKPRLIKEGMSRTDAAALVARLAASGAKAEVHQRGGPASHPKGAPSEASAFDVKLESWGTNKIQVIKIVRENTQLGLKEVKELVEAAPIVVRKAQTRAQAEKMIKELTAAGATATVLPSP